MSRVVVGVDGGGTKTHCSVIDFETEAVLGTGVSSCSNQNSVGKEKAKEAVSNAIFQALSAANLTVRNGNFDTSRTFDIPLSCWSLS
jgi:N-acetylglucosamine kinase-like BadF-type ATPase